LGRLVNRVLITSSTRLCLHFGNDGGRRTSRQTLTQSERLGGPPDPRPRPTHRHGPRTPSHNVENVTVTSVYCVVAAPPTLARRVGPFRRISTFYSFRVRRHYLLVKAPRTVGRPKNDRFGRGLFRPPIFRHFVVNTIYGNYQLSAKNKISICLSRRKYYYNHLKHDSHVGAQGQVALFERRASYRYPCLSRHSI